MLKDFYLAFAAASFTLLGLWMIVVQTRHTEWRGHPAQARRAYAVSLQFSLPGIMSLVTLADPDSVLVWRWSFGLVAIGGVIALVVLDGRKRTQGGTLLYGTAIVLYALIAGIALAPTLVRDVGVHAAPLRIEAYLLSAQLFLGVNAAWLLMFDEVDVEPVAARTGSS